MLRKPLLLLIDPHGLEVWQHTDGLLQARAGFDAHGHEAFSNWLAGLQQRPSCRVLVNLPDEDYEYEDLPRTRGRDRRALIARCCAAWFPHTPFVHAWPPAPRQTCAAVRNASFSPVSSAPHRSRRGLRCCSAARSGSAT